VSDPLPFTVKPIYWNASQKEVKAIRSKVFIEEQGVPPELEWDGLDEHSYHVLAFAPDGAPIGTGRLLQDGHIGRIAVLQEWRGKGVGRALLELLLVIANKMGNEEVKLHARPASSISTRSAASPSRARSSWRRGSRTSP